MKIEPSELEEVDGNDRIDTRFFDSLTRDERIAMRRCYRAVRIRVPHSGYYGLSPSEARELVGSFFCEVNWYEYLGSK